MSLMVEHVQLSRGGRRVLDDVSLTAHAGEVLALVGPNGAGKSSLLAVMAGLLPPSRGSASLDGIALGRWPLQALARRRAMLSQRVDLAFDFNAEDVVALGRSPHGRASSASDRLMAAQALRQVNASHLAGRRYLALSGGEQQRVQFARVLAQIAEAADGPRWLLLDEPEAGLDIAHQHVILRHARALAREGYGVVVVLHDLNLAAHYADRIAVLERGRLRRIGEPTRTLTSSLLSEVYGIELACAPHGDGGPWLVLPAMR